MESTCYYSYDTFLGMFEDSFRDLIKLVTIILDVGNHDVGFDPVNNIFIMVGNNN
jgi:hypothetical protein